MLLFILEVLGLWLLLGALTIGIYNAFKKGLEQ